MTSPPDPLFTPLPLTPHLPLTHRIVMGPISSNLASPSPHCTLSLPAAAHYYASRASTPGTLVIAEATLISLSSSGTRESRAGIFTPEQISAWKAVVDAVHAKGSFVFLQLWALGRQADAGVKGRDGSGDVVGASAVKIEDEGEGYVVPRALRGEEVWGYVSEYAEAAGRAVNEAGFDGVEVHGGNGCLVDQFTQEGSNVRKDEWGGSVEARAKFGVEVVKAIGEVVGFERVGYRVSPFSTYGGMGKGDLVGQFSYLLKELRGLGMAYVHLVESRIAGRVDVEAGEPLDPFLEILGDHPIVLAGGYTPESAREALGTNFKDKKVAVAFGRGFVKNEDFVQRLKDGTPLVD